MKRKTIEFLRGLCGASKDEWCGYVLEDTSIIVIKNVAASPHKEFLFDLEQQCLVVENLRDELIGIFHTHPSGSPNPSQKDIEGWPMIPGFRYWIATAEEVVEWRLVDDKPEKVWSSR